jgi:hypothetical protein
MPIKTTPVTLQNCLTGGVHFSFAGTHWGIPWDVSAKAFVYWDDLLPGTPGERGERARQEDRVIRTNFVIG